MGSLKKVALFGAFAIVVASTAASAADMPAAVYEPVAPVPYEVGSNWYLRGDLGYKWYGTPDAKFDYPGYGNMFDETLDNTGLVGLGFGYKFSDYFRSDLTVDYEWDSQFTGKLNCAGGCGYSTEKADISAWTTLVNFYWDIPLNGEGVGAFTPYVGAGLGASYLTTSSVNYTNPDGSTGGWKGAGNWNFAWAATIGGSYQITRNWLLDINYRYLDLGKAVSGKTLSQFNNKRLEYDDITAQEVRVGFRWLLN